MGWVAWGGCLLEAARGGGVLGCVCSCCCRWFWEVFGGCGGVCCGVCWCSLLVWVVLILP
ncbi:hypothetical protein RA268_27970 [Pseudomonas syringae pv. tagetis]